VATEFAKLIKAARDVIKAALAKILMRVIFLAGIIDMGGH
jgi:hypothetical protein